MMANAGELVCVFGTMKKSMTQNNVCETLKVSPTIVRRIIGKTDWWYRDKPGVRYFEEGLDSNFDLTYPEGYDLNLENKRNTIDKEYESIHNDIIKYLQ